MIVVWTEVKERPEVTSDGNSSGGIVEYVDDDDEVMLNILRCQLTY